MQTTRPQTPERRIREWLRLHDQALADQAHEAIESNEALMAGVMDVERTQFRALHNTAKMCGTVGELRDFVGKRAARRKEADKDDEDKAAFWEGLLGAISELKEDHVQPALEDCEVPEADSASIQGKGFDRRKAHLLIARRFIEHFATHAQYLHAKG